MFQVLLQVAKAMQAGLAVTVAPHHLTLSTQEAADLLRISRTTLVRLLETGVIPFDKPSPTARYSSMTSSNTAGGSGARPSWPSRTWSPTPNVSACMTPAPHR
jgi:hypothetical protein